MTTARVTQRFPLPADERGILLLWELLTLQIKLSMTEVCPNDFFMVGCNKENCSLVKEKQTLLQEKRAPEEAFSSAHLLKGLPWSPTTPRKTHANQLLVISLCASPADAYQRLAVSFGPHQFVPCVLELANQGRLAIFAQNEEIQTREYCPIASGNLGANVAPKQRWEESPNYCQRSLAPETGKELKGTEEKMRERAVKKRSGERWDEMVYNHQCPGPEHQSKPSLRQMLTMLSRTLLPLFPGSGQPAGGGTPFSAPTHGVSEGCAVLRAKN